MNIKYYIKEYFAIIFYFLVIFNVIIRVIYSKSNKSSKKRSKKKRTKRRNRKGGSLRTLWIILKIILCFLTFGLYCPGRGTQYYMLWDPELGRASSLYEYQDTEKQWQRYTRTYPDSEHPSHPRWNHEEEEEEFSSAEEWNNSFLPGKPS